MSEAVPKDFSLERKGRPIVKDSWLHEYIVANITAPQTFSAIAIFLSAAVLQDRPDTWDSFFNSSLSPVQVKKLGEIMSRAHAGMGVNHATKDETSHFPAGTDLAIVHETRIRKLWTDARNIVYKDLSTIFAEMNNWAPHPFTSPDKIDKFMKDPENTETLTKLLTIFSTIKKSFYSPETRKLLVDYKKTLTRHSKGTQSADADRSILMTVTKRELEQNGWDLADPLVKLVLETSVR